MYFVIAVSVLPLVWTAAAQSVYQAEVELNQTEDIPYHRYFTRDVFERRLIFYITKPANPAVRLPLVVSIVGSGADLNFIRRDGRILNGHRALRAIFAGRANVLIVEKPGVSFCEHSKRMGTLDGASNEFRNEYTLDRWAEAVTAALRASRTLLFIDLAQTLVLGHSEGGLVASRVAATNPFVTHVASRAGGGPTRLFSMIEHARAGDLPDEGEAKLLADWAAVMQDPDSTSKDFQRHPHRAWTNFAKASCMAELLRTKGRIYIPQGTNDHNVAPVTFDILRAHLLDQGREVTADRIIGADLGFSFQADPKRDGESELFGRIGDWFLME